MNHTWCGEVCCLNAACENNICVDNSTVKLPICKKWWSISINNLFSSCYLSNHAWFHLRGWIILQIFWNSKFISFHKHSHVIKNFFVICCQKSKRFSFDSCSSWSTCPMDELAYIFGSIITDNSIDAFNIKSSCT